MMALQVTAVIFILSFALLGLSNAAVDKTRETQAVGVDVVDAVIRKIRRSQIFNDDYDFLKRAALMETNFGQNPNTFTDPDAIGIWKVTPAMFNISKSAKLNTEHEAIMAKFDIDWRKVKWSDLEKPLHNGIAFRLYLHAIAPNLPQTLGKQDQLWKYIYQKDGSATGLFADKNSEFDQTVAKCRGLFDLTVVMDGSGSIGDEDFVKAKEFVINLFATYSSDSVRKAFVLFGDDAYMIFPLNNKLKTEELQEMVRNVTYPAEATNTNAGILMAVNMIASTPRRRQEGVPSILIVFTDGESNVGDGVSNIKLAKQNNITTFAVGIGARLNQTELLEIAYNNPLHLLLTKDYTTLESLVNRINAETCLVAQKPGTGVETEDYLLTQEYRYYEYPLDSRGIIVTVNNTNGGKVEGYYSFRDENPSAAVHDGYLNSTVTVITPPDDFWDMFSSTELEQNAEPSAPIYITLQGRRKENNYTIEVNPLDRPGVPKANRRKGSGSGANGEGGAGGNNGTNGGTNGNGTDGGLDGANGLNGNGANGDAGSNNGANGGSNGNGNSSGSGISDGTNGANGKRNGTGSGEYDSLWPNQWEWSAEAVDSKGPKDNAYDERRRKRPGGGNLGQPLDSGSFDAGKALPCPERWIGFMEFPGRCDIYTLCTFGIRVWFECAPGLHFDRVLKTCNFIQLANCGGPSPSIPNLSRVNVNSTAAAV